MADHLIVSFEAATDSRRTVDITTEQKLRSASL